MYALIPSLSADIMAVAAPLPPIVTCSHPLFTLLHSLSLTLPRPLSLPPSLSGGIMVVTASAVGRDLLFQADPTSSEMYKAVRYGQHAYVCM